MYTHTGRLIPLPIQVGTAIGIGLLTALAGCTDINVVERGTYNILKFGAVTPEICIAFFGVFIICVAINYRIRVMVFNIAITVNVYVYFPRKCMYVCKAVQDVKLYYITADIYFCTSDITIL